MIFNKKDFIYRKKGFVSQERCDFLINYFESNPDLHHEGKTAGNIGTNHSNKRDTEIFLLFPDDFSWIITDYLKPSVDEYCKEYPFISKGIASWICDRHYKIQRYYPGEAYHALHCENTGPDPSGEGMDKRMLAWMIYLNDVTDGGYTSFPTQNKKFQPRRGDFLIWPAYWTHPHRGIVSMTQTKYIITGWFDFAEC